MTNMYADYRVTFESRIGWWEDLENDFETKEEAIEFAESAIKKADEEFWDNFEAVTVRNKRTDELYLEETA